MTQRRKARLVVEFLIVAAVIVALVVFSRRLPSAEERRKLAQPVSVHFDQLQLEKAIQHVVSQTDGSFEVVVCASFASRKITLSMTEQIPVSQALESIASQIPAKLYPYGLLDVPVAHPTILCTDGSTDALIIRKLRNE